MMPIPGISSSWATWWANGAIACLGQVNTGIAIFEAPDEETAQLIVAGEPVTSGGYMPGDLRP